MCADHPASSNQLGPVIQVSGIAKLLMNGDVNSYTYDDDEEDSSDDEEANAKFKTVVQPEVALNAAKAKAGGGCHRQAATAATAHVVGVVVQHGTRHPDRHGRPLPGAVPISAQHDSHKGQKKTSDC